VKGRRYVVASAIAVAGFGALFLALPGRGSGVQVKLIDFRYRPSTITVHVGGAATFENRSTVTHTATCSKCSLDSGDIQPEMFKTLTFTKAGHYQLFCRYHGERGMVAEVIVKP